MSKLEIVGISGKAGSGKDYLGREILRPLGYQQWAFAWPMKNEAVGIGFTYEEVHDLKPPAVRDWLQRRGTEDGWMKHGVFYWCQIAEAWLRTIQHSTGQSKFYISDVRFLHEADFIRGLGGKLIRIEHGDRPNPLAGTAAELHSSETALDTFHDWDAVIVNNVGTSHMQLHAALARAGIKGAVRAVAARVAEQNRDVLNRLALAEQLELQLLDQAEILRRACL